MWRFGFVIIIYMFARHFVMKLAFDLYFVIILMRPLVRTPPPPPQCIRTSYKYIYVCLYIHIYIYIKCILCIQTECRGEGVRCLSPPPDFAFGNLPPTLPITLFFIIIYLFIFVCSSPWSRVTRRAKSRVACDKHIRWYSAL